VTATSAHYPLVPQRNPEVSTSVRHKHWSPLRDPLQTKTHTPGIPFQPEAEPLTAQLNPASQNSQIYPASQDTLLHPASQDTQVHTASQDTQLDPALQDRQLNPSSQDSQLHRASQDTQRYTASQDSSLTKHGF